MRSPPHEWEGPDLWEQGGASGVDGLPGRVNRYGIAKARAVDAAEYIGRECSAAVGAEVARCGEYLLFREYWTVDEVRLHAARFCRRHLLCPLCAIRRGAKALQAYLPRFESVRASRPDLGAFLVTLTVKDGADLRERFRHLMRSQRELWMRKHRGRSGWASAVEAAVWSYEVKRGVGSGLWHPHLHMVAMARDLAVEGAGALGALSAEWHAITGDSWMVDVRPISQAEPASGFLEVFKYAVKFSALELADLVEVYRVLSGRRLVGSAGLFRGVEIPVELTDEPLEGLPYVERLFRWFEGRRGYAAVPVAERGQGSAVASPASASC